MASDEPAPTSADFKEAVKAYIELHDEITASSKQLRELKHQKDAVGDIILQWMRSNSVDECELPDGKLIRKTSKRTQTLKKEFVLEELKKITGDEAKAEASMLNIFSMRAVVEKEVLSRTTRR
jgi:flagellar basal body-associated protein FliL